MLATPSFPVRFKRLTATAKMPTYGTEGAAGMDLYADETMVVPYHERYRVRTGICVAIPAGYVGLMCPRSGIAFKSGVTVLNSPGVIDCDYRGELSVLLQNHDRLPFRVKSGDRIAQLIIMPYVRAELIDSEELDETVRGSGGFGSTGIR